MRVPSHLSCKVSESADSVALGENIGSFGLLFVAICFQHVAFFLINSVFGDLLIVEVHNA